MSSSLTLHTCIISCDIYYFAYCWHSPATFSEHSVKYYKYIPNWLPGHSSVDEDLNNNAQCIAMATEVWQKTVTKIAKLPRQNQKSENAELSLCYLETRGKCQDPFMSHGSIFAVLFSAKCVLPLMEMLSWNPDIKVLIWLADFAEKKNP